MHITRRIALTIAAAVLLLVPFLSAPSALADQSTGAPSLTAQTATTPAVTTRWGSFAYSPSTLAWGSGWSTINSFTAYSYALTYCSQRASDCRSAGTWSNAWGALALSYANGPVGWGYAQTLNQAEINALYYCRVYGGANSCHVVATVDATQLP